MEKLSASEVASAVGGTLLMGDPGACVTGVATDTRAIKAGDLFFALHGEKSDGHQYIPKALENGATGLVVSDETAVPQDCTVFVVKVEDPLWALGDLAAYYRNKFDVRVVGVTGSVGKTTTKDLLASILERKWKVLKNEANYNNEIGVPLTIFNLDSTHEILITEMGMRGLGEIRRLAEIARPSIGIITNIGVSHIERLGSQGAIADAKGELLEELPPDGIAVMNMEDGYFMVLKSRFPGKIVTFGSCKDADVAGARITTDSKGQCRFVVKIEGAAIEVNMPVIGIHNVYNALAAAATAVALGVDLHTIRDGLEHATTSSMRMELVETRTGVKVLNDAYNASPASMLAALRTLSALSVRNRRIAVLGDMLELGDFGPGAHRDIGGAAASSGVNMLVTVGELSKAIAEGAREAGFKKSMIRICADSQEAAKALAKIVRDGDAVLVKGSRSMKMEEIVRALVGE